MRFFLSVAKVTNVAMVFLLAGVAFAPAGCQRDSDGKLVAWGKKKSKHHKKIVVPPEVAGTVAEVASLISGGDAPITGTGIVVGLDKKGSSEVPPTAKRKLKAYLTNEIKLGRATYNLESVTPEAFLNDHDTAAVSVDAVIPPGAPKGTRIDVAVSALPRTQTTSLAGGVLLPTRLHWDVGKVSENKYLKSLGWAEGTVFVNPFLDPTNPSDAPRYRQGVIMNGAKVVRDMPIRLELRKPNYHVCRTLQKRINERFSAPGRKIAVAKNRYNIEIKIPPGYRKNYRYFLKLLMHLPRTSGPAAYEARAKRVARAMLRPGANHDGLALVWEAMGKSILATVQRMYSSKNQAASFFAARAGLRLGDKHLAGPVVISFAVKPGPHQLLAIKELGYHADVLEATAPLRKLLDDRNELVRIYAYEALLARGDDTSVTRYNVDGEFLVDIVDTAGEAVIYVIRTGQPKIVLFGRNMPIANPVFYCTSDKNVTIFSKKADPAAKEPELWKPHIAVYRKIPRTERRSDEFRVGFKVWPLIRVLGSPPRPSRKTWDIQGIGLTYSQIVSILCKMSQQNLIEAKFVLQKPTELQRIYQHTPSVGRPDKPTR